MHDKKRDLFIFAGELFTLCKKYGIIIQGKLRVLSPDDYIGDSQTIERIETMEVNIGSHIAQDRCGPFIICNAERKIIPPIDKPRKYNSNVIIDKDAPLKDGVVNPIDGQRYDSRHKWDEILKRNHCHQAETTLPENRKIQDSDMKGNYKFRDTIGEQVHRACEEGRI